MTEDDIQQIFLVECEEGLEAAEQLPDQEVDEAGAGDSAETTED